jgi:uncharacterized membrane protein YfcA
MDAMTIVIAMAVTGAVGGLLAGMLGVGGGIVIVPVLELVLGILGVDISVRMHVAVGTSLATIVPTSVASALAHYRRQSIALSLVRRWAAWIVLGAILGTLVAGEVSSLVLYVVFAAVAFLVAIKMMLPAETFKLGSEVPAGVAGALIPAGIGGVSAMMGIGGGTLSVPVMNLYGMPIHRAVGTSALFGVFISVPAALGFIYTGWGNAELPQGSLGFVNLIGFLLIIPATIVCAPLGARIAHALSRRTLSILFGIFLLLVALRMLSRALA